MILIFCHQNAFENVAGLNNYIDQITWGTHGNKKWLKGNTISSLRLHKQ